MSEPPLPVDDGETLPAMPPPPIADPPPPAAEDRWWVGEDVAGDRVDVSTEPVVAGDPAGARVELTSDGLHAYDATGTETATIRGEEGVFVGGEFRTSDALPGQVTLSDTAYVNSYDDTKQGPGDPAPGISVEPINTANLATNPGIGPYLSGIKLDGGSNTSGGWSSISANPTSAVVASDNGAGGRGHLQVSPNWGGLHASNATGTGLIETTPARSSMSTTGTGGASGKVEVSPSATILRTYSGNGSESGWVRAQATDAELASVGTDNVYTSRIRTTATEASLFSRAGGANRYLTIDADGVWVKTNKSGTWKSYNLEETAQDSGWVNLSYASGFASAGSGGPFQIRRMGGMTHLRGRLARTSGTIVAGTEYTIGTLSSSWRPAYTQRTLIAGGSSSQWGRIEVSAITGEISIAAISGDMNWVDLSGTLWTVD